MTTIDGRTGLDAEFGARQGRFTLEVALQVPPGGVLAVVGPNGAGKTTTLRCLAGLTRLERGRIAVGTRVLDEPRSHSFVAPARRSVGVLFQDYRLFPRMSVLDNVAFGLRARHMARRPANQLAADWLARVGLTEYARARPDTLSGGQAQRVALARALAARPEVLLLDEPFAALDAEARLDLRADLADHLGSFHGATVLVTHDPHDALTLADRILVLDAGRVADQGTTADVVARPRSPFVAKLVGTNLLSGECRNAVAEFGALRLPAPTVVDGAVFATFPPSAVVIDDGSPADQHRLARQDRLPPRTGRSQPTAGRTELASDHRLRVPAQVRRIVAQPGFSRAYLTGNPDLIADLPSEQASSLNVGLTVTAVIDATAVQVYSGAR